MAGAHHTAFLLAILIGILLLLFVACVYFLCHYREKCLPMRSHVRKRMMLNRLTKEQATSMTCVSVNFLDRPSLPFYEAQTSKAISFSLSKSIDSQQEEDGTSCTTLENWATVQSKRESLGQQARVSSALSPVERQECEESYRASNSYCLCSSSPSNMERSLRNAREFSKVERTCSNRCSSSMISSSSLKSKLDLLQTPQESTIPDATSLADIRPTSQEGHCSVISQTESPLQFLWRSSTSTSSRNSLLQISQQSVAIPNQSSYTESVSVPGTLKVSSMTAMNLEGKSLKGQSLVHLPKTCDLLSPKAWFIFLGNGPSADSPEICKNNINNVTSLDSGVDILEHKLRQENKLNKGSVQELPHQQGILEHSSTLEAQARCSFKVEELHCSGPIENPRTGVMEEGEPEFEVQISHAEAALKLNEVHYGNKRSQWQKREERPLMGIF